MSRIADRVNEIKAMREMEVGIEEKKTSVSIRVDDFTLFCADLLKEEMGCSRTAVCLEMISEGVLEGLEAVGLTLDELQARYLAQKTGRDLEAVKADLAKTGFSNKEVK